MKHITFLLICCLLFIFSSCKESKKEKLSRLVEEWQGKEIVFPQNMIFTNSGEDTIDYVIPKNGNKILVYVDSIGCISCKLQLPRWKQFIAKIDSITNGTVPVLFFFHPKKLKELRYIFKRDHFVHPVCIDFDDKINILNQFPPDMTFQTFLLDENNKVKVIGNPIHNLSVQKLYIQTLSNEQPSTEEFVKTSVDVPVQEIDLGTMKKGETKDADFIITNTGNHPLQIIGMTFSCDCITGFVDKEEVATGESATITLRYKADEEGDFLRIASLYCNAENMPIEFSIIGTVK